VPRGPSRAPPPSSVAHSHGVPPPLSSVTAGGCVPASKGMAYFSLSWMPCICASTWRTYLRPRLPRTAWPSGSPWRWDRIVPLDIARPVGRLLEIGKGASAHSPRSAAERAEGPKCSSRMDLVNSIIRVVPSNWAMTRTRRGSSAPGRPARWPNRYAVGADHGCRAAETSADTRSASPGRIVIARAVDDLEGAHGPG
jgi:hypothetical protein